MFVRKRGEEFLAKIAAELKHALERRIFDGSPGNTTQRVLAAGQGWSVSDVVCTFGPRDRSFEEQHSGVSISIVTSGSFQYRGSTPYGSAATAELMTPGSLMLGNAGQFFECGHEHGAGDRCLLFRYTPDYFERAASDNGINPANRGFRVLRLPHLRALSPLIARACAYLTGHIHASWEEVCIQLAAQTIQLERGVLPSFADAPPSAVARVTLALRRIERHPTIDVGLGDLAQEAKLSPYHFLRTFERLTGVTPHQYVQRTRLREAAVRLAVERRKVLDIAFDCGFGDVSNFNRAFRAEFGVSPRIYRLQTDGRASPSRVLSF